MTYSMSYLGIGGIEECGIQQGNMESLAEHINMIEEHGGWSLTVTEAITGSVVYECGGFVVNETTLDLGALY